jgi:hypothetical protein
MWMTIKDLASYWEVSVRTAWRRIDKLGLKSRKIPNPNGGKFITEIELFEHSKQCDTFQENQNKLSNVTLLQKHCDTQKNNLDNLTEQVKIGKHPHRVYTPNAGAASSPAPAPFGLSTLHKFSHYPVDFWDDGLSDDLLPPKYEKEAQLKAALCEKAILVLSKAKTKTRGWEAITDAYNSGLIIPELFELKGKQSIRTMQRWLKTYKDNDKNYSALAPNYIIKERGRAVSQIEQDFLLKELLDPNRVTPGAAVRKIKQMARHGVFESKASERTLLRWIADYKRDNIEI